MQGFAPSMLVLGPGFRHAHPEIPTPPPSALETWLCLLCHGWLFDLEFGGFFEIKELDTARTTVFALHALLAFTFMSLVEPIKRNVSLQGYTVYLPFDTDDTLACQRRDMTLLSLLNVVAEEEEE